MTSPQSEVRALLQAQVAAIRAKDLDALMAVYSPDIVYFDIVPPLQFAGAEALRGRFERWFAGFQGPIDMEVRDVTITHGADTAVAHWFSRANGVLQDGRRVGVWVRATSCSARTSGQWLVFHEHISAPIDMATGRPALDLTPG